MLRSFGRTFAAALVLAVVAAAPRADAVEYKIGFVNTERILRESAPAKRAQQKLEREFESRAADLQKTERQVRELSQQLERDGATMSDAERRNKERDLASLTREFQRSQREYREDVNLRRNEELAALQERASRIIQQIAESEKFDLILQEAVFASGRIDITDRVLKALADR